MSETKDKTIRYRKCQITAKEGIVVESLQVEMEKAARAIKQPWKKILSTDGKVYQLLTELSTKHGCLCGSITKIEEGHGVALLDIKTDGTTWENVVDPLDDKGVRRKFRNKSLCFAVKENHAAIIASTEVKIEDLQAFAAWMLCEARKDKCGYTVTLENVPAKSALEKLRNNEISKVRVGNDLFNRVEMPPEEEKTTKTGRQKKKRFEFQSDPMMMQVLKALLKNSPVLDKFTHDADPGSLYVGVDIRYKSKSEKEGRELVNAVAGAFGGNESLDSEIFLKGGGKIKNEELSISGIVAVQHYKKVLTADDGMSKAAEWLLAKIKDKSIPL